jgi:hypothetical protein
MLDGEETEAPVIHAMKINLMPVRMFHHYVFSGWVWALQIQAIQVPTLS